MMKSRPTISAVFRLLSITVSPQNLLSLSKSDACYGFMNNTLMIKRVFKLNYSNFINLLFGRIHSSVEDYYEKTHSHQTATCVVKE